MPTVQPVRVSYSKLKNDPASVTEQVKAALGNDKGCLGVILIEDLPAEFPQLRERLFRLAYAFATMPEAQREKLASPESAYSFGWSHGKEVMNGRPDTLKGSFYANPLLDVPDVSEQKRAEHPEYYAGNIWPKGIAEVEGFEQAFKDLGRLIADIGVSLAHACEPFIAVEGKSIAQLISESKTNKARLLHYYPEAKGSVSAEDDGVVNDALCGTHIDHSLLTGLCSAMYLSPGPDGPQVVGPPSPNAGLYIYPRGEKTNPVKVQIPANGIAFQTGEALELLTGGRLAATPHFVSGGLGPNAGEVSRETYAFFLQPDVDDVLSKDETFGSFTKRVLERHYADIMAKA